MTQDQLLATGLSRGGIAKRVERGALHRVHRGVYAVGHTALSREGAWLAAVFGAGAGSALSHLSAAELNGISRFRASRIDVVSPRLRALEGVTVHRSRTLRTGDITTHKRIPVTTVHRLFVDLSDVLTPYQVANVIHEAAFRGRYAESAVRDVMARSNGRHNLAVLEKAIALHRPWARACAGAP